MECAPMKWSRIRLRFSVRTFVVLMTLRKSSLRLSTTSLLRSLQRGGLGEEGALRGTFQIPSSNSTDLNTEITERPATAIILVHHRGTEVKRSPTTSHNGIQTRRSESIL